MEIQFTKVNPTQNMTILVESPVPRHQHPHVAGCLMEYGSVYAEQVGFVEEAADKAAWARLQMMGGEFCGNAAMSLAAFLVWQRCSATKEAYTVPLEVSGAQEVLHCRVVKQGEHYRVTVAMPPPTAIERCCLSLEGERYQVSILRFDGITHIVVPTAQLPGDPRGFAARAAAVWRGQAPQGALGILLFDRDAMRIDPLIHVHSTASTIWERGCGSGTAAIGALLADEVGGNATAQVLQPGGAITVEAHYEGTAVSRLSITGTVLIAARGIAYIQWPQGTAQ